MKKLKILSIIFLILLDNIPFSVLQAEETPIRFAITPVIPERFLEINLEMTNYIADKVGRSIAVVQRRSYQEINELIKRGEVDMAFVGGVTYILGRDESGMELLVAPVVQDASTNYYSYIIVRNENQAKGLPDLRGKRYAFTDSLSTSGKLLPTYLLARVRETPETFFKKYIYTYSHAASIEAVRVGLVDGASIDSYIWEFYEYTDPKFISGLKIIQKDEVKGTTPIVVRSSLEPGLKERLRRAFLDMDKEQKGREILKRNVMKGFAMAEDALYNDTRKMISYIERFSIKKRR